MAEHYQWLGQLVYWSLFPLIALQNLWSYKSTRKRSHLIAAGLSLIIFIWIVVKYLRLKQ